MTLTRTLVAALLLASPMQTRSGAYDGPFRNHAFRNCQLKVDVMTRPGSNGGIWIKPLD